MRAKPAFPFPGHFRVVSYLLVAAFCVSCGNSDVVNLTDYSSDTLPPPVVSAPKTTLPDPPITAKILTALRPSDGFDFPVGPPNARRYYKFRGFLPQGLEHLGEDWNGNGGGNSDFGDFVHSVSEGMVFISQDYGAGWGTVIRILHNYGSKENPQYIESVYAHVQSSWVKPGWRIKRGEKIGTIGTAENKYHAHLHFEMRKSPGKDIGCGYDGDTLGFVDPTIFIEAHRPNPAK